MVLAGRLSVWRLLQSCHALRNEMAHLCGQLQAYLMFEVLERAWVDLTARLAHVSHLDGLIGKARIHFAPEGPMQNSNMQSALEMGGRGHCPLRT